MGKRKYLYVWAWEWENLTKFSVCHYVLRACTDVRHAFQWKVLIFHTSHGNRRTKNRPFLGSFRILIDKKRKKKENFVHPTMMETTICLNGKCTKVIWNLWRPWRSIFNIMIYTVPNFIRIKIKWKKSDSIKSVHFVMLLEPTHDSNIRCYRRYALSHLKLRSMSFVLMKIM